MSDCQSTDVAGGHSPSMFDAMRQCITASTVMAFSKTDSYKSLTYKDAFKLATLGGSEGKNKACCVGSPIVIRKWPN